MSNKPDHTQPVPVIGEGATLGVIGAGVMGQTLLRGLLSGKQVGARLPVGRRQESRRLRRGVGGARHRPSKPTTHARVPTADLILLCVKPNDAPVVLATLRNAGLRRETLLISILAGVGTDRLESLLGTENPVVRAMPNTPAVVGEGMTVVCRGRYAIQDRPAARARDLRSGGPMPAGRRDSLQRHYRAERQRAGLPVPDHGSAGGRRRAGGAAAAARPHAGGADRARRRAHGALHRPPSGRPARRRHHAGRLHHRRPADAGRRAHPLGAGAGGGGSHQDLRPSRRRSREDFRKRPASAPDIRDAPCLEADSHATRRGTDPD